MRNSAKNIEIRRERLIEIIKQKQVTNVHDLARLVNVSEMSVRRDCSALQKMGKIKTTFGKIEYRDDEGQSESDQIDAINGKIAQAAVDYISDNQIIFINSSRTAIKVLDYLGDKRINVLTNNLRSVGMKLNNESTLVLSGGEIRPGSHILTGDIALAAFQDVRASVSLVGCGGLDVKNGLTTTNIHEAQINRMIVKNCQKLVVLANYTKINKTTNFTVGSLKDIDVLVTDDYANENAVKRIRNAGVEVIQVPV